MWVICWGVLGVPFFLIRLGFCTSRDCSRQTSCRLSFCFQTVMLLLGLCFFQTLMCMWSLLCCFAIEIDVLVPCYYSAIYLCRFSQTSVLFWVLPLLRHLTWLSFLGCFFLRAQIPVQGQGVAGTKKIIEPRIVTQGLGRGGGQQSVSTAVSFKLQVWSFPFRWALHPHRVFGLRHYECVGLEAGFLMPKEQQGNGPGRAWSW